MRSVKDRKPKYFRNGKPIYNPGFVDCYQKPWYISFSGDVKYYGRFAEDGYPGKVYLEFDPLRKLIGKINDIDPRLKAEIMTMIEEMEDAHSAEENSYIDNLPSAD